ncbi:GH25 family lysozyme [Rhizobium sp. AN80A]|uniref:glycoside hydrolase family 25 protein n=1 Tax=Rhizobium sp. AN80A TaxID=3040673 RepID=UPI0024B35C49|nr:GH25 family lysozyme [Rhizobium sp. AN80A]
MRFSAVPAIVLVCLTLAGCTSTSGPDVLASAAPSRETTNSIAPPAAVPSSAIPSADIGASGQQVAPSQEVLAWAGPIPEPKAFEPTTRTVGAPLPAERPMTAMMVPPARPPLAEPAVQRPDLPDMDETGQPRTRSKLYGRQFRDAKPINFGSASPQKLPVHGVDVSRWQGDIDWPKLRTQGANFAYIKATDGGDHLDPMFKTNWRKAKDAGLRRGAYHFFYWCRTAGEQADWFIRNVPRDPDALPPVIDVEWNGESACKRRPTRETVLEKMQVFMDKLENYYGKRPVIYTAPDFYADNLQGAFQNYPFWLRSVAAHPSKRYPGRKWVFWQYSGSGLSHGVEGKIDLNVFNGSPDQWMRWSAGRPSNGMMAAND